MDGAALRAMARSLFVLFLIGATPVRADTVRVRAEGDERSARLILSWPQPVHHEAMIADGRLTLRFDRPIETDLAALLALDRWLKEPRIGDASKSLSVRLSRGVTALAHGDGSEVVVDLIAPPPSAAGRSSPPSAAGGSSPPPAAGKTSPPKAAAGPTTPPEATADHSANAGDGSEAATDLPGRRQRAPWPRPADAPTPAQAGGTQRADDGGQSSDAGTRLAASRPASLRFAWSAPTAAALVPEEGVTWLVFDRPSAPDVGALLAAAKGAIHHIDDQSDADATVLGLHLAEGVRAHLIPDGSAWSLALGDAAGGAVHAIPAESTAAASPQAADAKLVLHAAVGRTQAHVRTGDAQHNLVIVPVRAADTGMPAARAYPEFRLGRTGQGLAIQPLADDVRIALGADFVEIGRPGGLQLSAEPPAPQSTAGAPARRERLLFPLPDDQANDQANDQADDQAGEQSFAARRSALERTSANASGIGREQARLAQCELFLAHGFATECLGLLELIDADRESAHDERRFRFLRGVANLLTGRLADARSDLGDPALAANDETRLWLAVLAAMDGRAGGDVPAGSVARWQEILAAYPQGVRFTLARWLADASLDQGSPAAAKRLMETMAGAATTERERAWLPYFEGRLFASQGKAEKARAAWAHAETDPSHPASARLRFAQIELDLKQKKLDAHQAIAALDQLRDAWRGDPFEFRVLCRLGRLQIEAGEYADGMRTLDAAARRFQDLPQAAEVAREVAQTFERLALGDLADKVSPLAAIALLHDFKALVPPGEKGREVARRQAQRLIGVDLLPEAATVLEELLAAAPAGEERARDGLRLAQVYGQDGKPDAALAALQRSAADALPAPLVRARNHVTARALAALGRNEDALAAITGDTDDDALRLRARIFRGEEDWADAGASLDRLLAAEGQAAGADAQQKQDTVLDLAATLALANDRDGAERLRQSHGAAMAKTKAADAFDILTGGLPPPGADVEALKAYVDEADAIRQLLDPSLATGAEKNNGPAAASEAKH